jgi:hypothetical protein
MNAIKMIFAFSLSVFAAFAIAEPVVVQGEELRNLVVTDKGTTWTLSNGSRLTFLPNGKLYDCAVRQSGNVDCDAGTYVLTENSVERKYENWFGEADGHRKVVIKRDGSKVIFNGFDVVKYDEAPTLLPPPPLTTAELAIKKAATQRWLARDSISIRLWSKGNGQQEAGIIGMTAIASTLEAFPRKGKMNTHSTGDQCWKGQIDANIFERNGDLVMQLEPQASYCDYRVEYVFDPITMRGKSIVLFKNGRKSVSSSWVELLN